MSANRSAVGVVALWATFCVVLLAAAWLSGGQRSSAAEAIGPSHASSATASDSRLKLPPAPCPEAPVAETKAAAEIAADPEATAAHLRLRPRRAAWVARVPLWPADALRWQRMEPALRLNPGHAPPYA